MRSQAHLGSVSKESREFEYCRNDAPDSLICNLYFEGFILNELPVYNFRIYKS